MLFRSANATPYSWDEMTAALQLLEDETTTIAFHFGNLSEAASFRVTSLVQKNEAEKTTLKSEVEALVDVAKEAAELSDDVDLKKAQKDTEKALKMAGETVELAGKMLDMLGN